MAKKGWKVVILDMKQADGEKVAESINGDFFQVDVRSWSSQYVAFQKVWNKHGRIDFGQPWFFHFIHSLIDRVFSVRERRRD